MTSLEHSLALVFFTIAPLALFHIITAILGS